MQDQDQKDPRQKKLEEAVVYGIYEEGDLLYVGVTCSPLSRRLTFHKNGASQHQSRFYRYLDTEADLDDLTIHHLPHDSEKEAISDLDPPLNEQEGSERHEYRGPVFTSDQIDDLLDEDTTLASFAERHDVSYNTAQAARQKITGERRSFTHVDWDDVISRLGEEPDPEIAEDIGCSTSAVLRKRRELGIDACSQHALSDEEAREVLISHAVGDATYAELADRFDVSLTLIGRIVRGESYEHVDRPASELTGVQAVKTLSFAACGRPVEWIAWQLYAMPVAVQDVLTDALEQRIEEEREKTARLRTRLLSAMRSRDCA